MAEPAVGEPDAPTGAVSTMMRRVVVSADREVGVHRVAVPAPMPGEALVRTVAAGICGSDIHALHGRHPFIPLPYSPGHEVLGVVVEAAEGVRAARRPACGRRAHLAVLGLQAVSRRSREPLRELGILRLRLPAGRHGRCLHHPGRPPAPGPERARRPPGRPHRAAVDARARGAPGGAARGQGCRRPWRRHHRSHGVGGRWTTVHRRSS